MERCQDTLQRIQINTMHENKAGFEALSSQKKVSLLLRQIRTIQRWLKLVQEVFLFFPSESFSVEEGFSHTASGHIYICIRRKKCEVNECAFCWLIVNLQTSSHPLPWHPGLMLLTAYCCRNECTLLDHGLLFWNFPPFTQNYVSCPPILTPTPLKPWSQGWEAWR